MWYFAEDEAARSYLQVLHRLSAIPFVLRRAGPLLLARSKGSCDSLRTTPASCDITQGRPCPRCLQFLSYYVDVCDPSIPLACRQWPLPVGLCLCLHNAVLLLSANDQTLGAGILDARFLKVPFIKWAGTHPPSAAAHRFEALCVTTQGMRQPVHTGQVLLRLSHHLSPRSSTPEGEPKLVLVASLRWQLPVASEYALFSGYPHMCQ